MTIQCIYKHTTPREWNMSQQAGCLLCMAIYVFARTENWFCLIRLQRCHISFCTLFEIRSNRQPNLCMLLVAFDFVVSYSTPNRQTRLWKMNTIHTNTVTHISICSIYTNTLSFRCVKCCWFVCSWCAKHTAFGFVLLSYTKCCRQIIDYCTYVVPTFVVCT